VVAEVNRVAREDFDGNLLLPAAAAMVAKRYRADFRDLLDRLTVEVLKEKGS
jgi:hypothetical protein